MYRLLDDGGPVTWTYPMIEARTKEIFAQMGYDENNVLSEREFIIGCMNDMNIANLVLYRKGILP